MNLVDLFHPQMNFASERILTMASVLAIGTIFLSPRDMIFMTNGLFAFNNVLTLLVDII